MRAPIVLLLVLPALVMLGGCAAVRMTDEEAVICRDDPEGCTAWTRNELRELQLRAARQGYRRGWTDALQQRGEGI